MKKLFFPLLGLCSCIIAAGQSLPQRLQKAWQQFTTDSQLRYAASSLYVIDAATGQVVFDQHSRLGLAPASTEKIITSVTAFELLGRDFRYATGFGITERNGKPFVLIQPSGDPTLGSGRWESSAESAVLGKMKSLLKDQSRQKLEGFVLQSPGWSSQSAPDGWIWQDIGNYYGAGAAAFNWRENQFDLYLKSGKKIGDSVTVAGTTPKLDGVSFNPELRSAAKGTGDNAYIYLPADGKPELVIRGTIPVEEEKFKISGTIPDPFRQFAATVFAENKELFKENTKPVFLQQADTAKRLSSGQLTHFSPALDSIIYWFNKKSINLYGEALVKTMGFVKKGSGSTEAGVTVLRDFWKEKGIDPEELNLYDGSGLSPLNRVTTHAQVEILKYAKTRDWFPAFLQALPEYNGMTMKSGTISDVKGFCGYHTSKEGKEYIFSILVNNYSGRSSVLVAKIYKLLDELK